MLDTIQLIQEIKKRECLWNKNHSDYNDPDAKRLKWEEVGNVVYEDWDSLEFYVKDDKVMEMTKKWRNIRDYYKKHKKKEAREESIPNRGKFIRKRRHQYFDILDFLDDYKNDNYKSAKDEENQDTVNFSDDATDSSNNEEILQEETIEVIEQKLKSPKVQVKRPRNGSGATSGIKSETTTGATSGTTSKTYVQTHSLPSLIQSQDNSHSIAVRNFLLSLLPDVESLNDHQYMSFRLGVLNLLNNIKFNDDSHESWVISTLDNTS